MVYALRCGAAETARPASCPHDVVSVRRTPRGHAHPSSPPVSPLHCHGQGLHPSPLVGSSYHEQLVHLALAFNVSLVVGKHLKPETQSRVRLGFACCRVPAWQDRAARTSSCGQAGLSPWPGAPRPAGKVAWAGGEQPTKGDACQDSPVVVHEHVDNVPEATRVSRGEKAAADLVDGLPQLWQPLVVLPRVVPAPSRDGL